MHQHMSILLSQLCILVHRIPNYLLVHNTSKTCNGVMSLLHTSTTTTTNLNIRESNSRRWPVIYLKDMENFWLICSCLVTSLSASSAVFCVCVCVCVGCLLMEKGKNKKERKNVKRESCPTL